MSAEVGRTGAPPGREVRARWPRGPRLAKYAALILALVVWEIVGHRVSPIFLVPFHVAVVEFFKLLASGVLLAETARSLAALIIGMISATVLGIGLGLLMGRYRPVRLVAEPFVNAAYATPLVALTPLFILWFGIDLLPKVFIIGMLAFFPIVKNTFAGAANVSQEVLEPAISFGAREAQIFVKVVIPSCVPFVIAGLRLGIGRGVVGMVVAEFLTAITGLSGLLVQYAGRFKTAQMFAPLFVIVMIGYGLTELLKSLHERLAPWKRTERDVAEA